MIPPAPPTSIQAEDILKMRREWRDFDRWPRRNHPTVARLEPETWPIVRPKFGLGAARKVFTIGSCFARNIEEHLAAAGYEIPTLRFNVRPPEWLGRPNGIMNKFTPPSIYQELAWTWAMQDATDDDERLRLLAEPLIDIGDKAIDAQLAGFIPVTRERAIERRLELFEVVREVFSSDVVTFTLGLIEAWWDCSTGQYIQQTPGTELIRAYPGRFYFVTISAEDALKYMRESFKLIRMYGKPGVKFLITTSPVPLGTSFMGDDIIVSNMYAKSLLRYVSGVLSMESADVGYFPSYESVILTKDSSIWHDDLVHIKDEFVGKIVKHLLASYFGEIPAP